LNRVTDFIDATPMSAKPPNRSGSPLCDGGLEQNCHASDPPIVVKIHCNGTAIAQQCVRN
jgi:hypothetical protein